MVIFYVLNENFSYTQVASAFVPQKGFDIFLGPYLAFCIFLLQTDFDIFCMLFFRVFLCAFDNIYCHFLYITTRKTVFFFFKWSF